jgi:hypothetical protein
MVAQCRTSNLAHGHRPQGVVACHAWSSERLAGPRPAGPVQRRSGPCASAGSRASGMLVAQSPRVVDMRDGVVECSSAARWWLAGGKVLSVSSRGPQGGHRTRRVLAGLTMDGGPQ